MAHTNSTRLGRMLIVLLSIAILSLCTLPLQAESGEPESAESSSFPAQTQGNPSGFRIREPIVYIGGHWGANFPRADSDLFDMVTRELTLEKNDFRSSTVAFDFGVLIQSHWAAVFALEYGRTSKVSESRDWVDENDQPIRQTTRFRQLPVTGTIRYYPIAFGESVGSYAWVPTRVLPYVGAGVGFIHYKFRQEGDFVDNVTLDIFSAEMESSGFALTKHLVAGADISLTPLIMLNMEARYNWARADLSGNYRDFYPIDLAGFRLSGGVCFRF